MNRIIRNVGMLLASAALVAACADTANEPVQSTPVVATPYAALNPSPAPAGIENCENIPLQSSNFHNGEWLQMGASNLTFSIDATITPKGKNSFIITFDFNGHRDEQFAAWFGKVDTANPRNISWKLYSAQLMEQGVTVDNGRYTIFQVFADPSACPVPMIGGLVIDELKAAGQWPTN
ncbi:MAG TPA: hypothetical protein VLA77_04320 [Candidatus Saccharimonadales bacterium]|nr:hypothetical protein [Candidatus Saccharimonadales bacterium]